MAEANAENSDDANLQEQLQRIQGLDFLTKDSWSVRVDDTDLHIFPRLTQGTTSDIESDDLTSRNIRFISERTGTQLLDVLLDAREGEGTVDQLRETLDHALTVFEVVGIE